MRRTLLCAILMAWSGLASALVYKWTDAQGKIQYGDRPPDGVNAELVELPGIRSSSQSTPSRPTPPPPAARTAQRSPAAGNSDDPAKKAIDDDVAQTREKQCADAQEHYQKLIEGRRLYKVGADGERQYLTSEEIDSERVNAKHELDSICNSPT